MAWDSHHPKTGSPLGTRKALSSAEGSENSGPRLSSTDNSDARAEMSLNLGDQDFGRAGPPPLVVHVAIRFTDPIIRSKYDHTYNSSPGFAVTSRICDGLLRRIEHCSEELITRKDSGALDCMVKDAEKSMRYEMKFRVFRRATGAWAERTFRSYQKHPLTVEAAREIVLASHRIIGLYLRRHDKDFEVIEGGFRMGSTERPELTLPSLDGPISPLYMPQTQLSGVSHATDAEFVPGYTIQLSFKSRSPSRREHWFRRMLEIRSRQTAPLTTLAAEDLLWQGIQDIQQRLRPVQQDYQRHLDDCTSTNCLHSGEGALHIDLQVMNSLGPSTDQKHRNVTSKLLMFRDTNFEDCKKFLEDLEKTFADARDRLDQEINNLDDFEFQVLELKGRQGPKDWGWTMEKPAELQFRLGPSDVYSRSTIEAALDRIQTGVGDVIRGHNIAIRFHAYKRGHEILDKAIVAKEKAGKPKETFPSPEAQKAAIVSRLQQRIQHDLDMVCKDTCSIDDIEGEPALTRESEVASVAGVGAVALERPTVAPPPICVEQVSKSGEKTIEITSGRESPRTPKPARPSSSRSFSLVSFPLRTSTSRKEKVKAQAEFLISSGSQFTAPKERTSEPSTPQSSPFRPATADGLATKSAIGEGTSTNSVKEPFFTITTPEKKVIIMDEPQKDGRSLRKLAFIKNTVKAAKRSFALGSKKRNSSSPTRPSTARPSTASTMKNDLFAALSDKTKKRYSSATMMERPITEMPTPESASPVARPMTAMPAVEFSPRRIVPEPTTGGSSSHVEVEEKSVLKTSSEPVPLAEEERTDDLAPSESIENALPLEEYAYIGMEYLQDLELDPETSMLSDNTQTTAQTLTPESTTLTVLSSVVDSERESTAPSTPALSSGNDSSPRNSLIITPRHMQALSSAPQLEDTDRTSANDVRVSESEAVRLKSLGAHPEAHRATSRLPLSNEPGLSDSEPTSELREERGASSCGQDLFTSHPVSTPSTMSLPEPTPEPKVMEIATGGLASVPTLSGLQPTASTTAVSDQKLVSEPVEQIEKPNAETAVPSKFSEQSQGVSEPMESVANETASVPEASGWLGHCSTDLERKIPTTAGTGQASERVRHGSGSQDLIAPTIGSGRRIPLTSLSSSATEMHEVLLERNAESTGTVRSVGVTDTSAQELERVPDAIEVATTDLTSVTLSTPSGPTSEASATGSASLEVVQEVKLANTEQLLNLTKKQEPGPESKSHATIQDDFKREKQNTSISDPRETPNGEIGRSSSDLRDAPDPVAEVRADRTLSRDQPTGNSGQSETAQLAQDEAGKIVTKLPGPESVPDGSDGRELAPDRVGHGTEAPRISREGHVTVPDRDSASISDNASVGESLRNIPSGPSDWSFTEGNAAVRKTEAEVRGSGFTGSVMNTLRTLRNPTTYKPSETPSAKSSSVSVISDSESYYADSVSTVVPDGRGSVETVPLADDESRQGAESNSPSAPAETYHQYRPSTAGYLGLHEERLVDVGLRGALTGTRRFSIPLDNLVVLSDEEGESSHSRPLQQKALTTKPSLSGLSRKRKEKRLKRNKSRRAKNTSDALTAVGANKRSKKDPEQPGADVVLPRVMMLVGAVAVATRLWQKAGS